MTAITLTAVRQAHDRYAESSARWGEDNQATMRDLIRYHDLRETYESRTGKEYKR